jgi:serine/threonine protein kinase
MADDPRLVEHGPTEWPTRLAGQESQVTRPLDQSKRAATDPAAGSSPRTIGEYTILNPIGAGGMGQVYKAIHRRMDRVVALKILPPEAVSSPEAVERFHREVRVAARLIHPNIVTAYDAGDQAGVHFLVMEYVEGDDLYHHVRENGPVSVDRALSCIRQAARGLEYAHQNGVFHRDIKPGNLLLGKDGTIKLLDMGLALLRGGADTAPLTRTGAFMGTADYMAPEQAQSATHVDQRSDVYSLGCTLYFLLTGNAMYQANELIQKVMAHREQPIPSLCRARLATPEALDGIFHRMVAKKPQDRYASMTDLIADLERLGVTNQKVAADGREHGRQAILGLSRQAWIASGVSAGAVILLSLAWMWFATSARTDHQANPGSVPVAPAAPSPPRTPAVANLGDKQPSRRNAGMQARAEISMPTIEAVMTDPARYQGRLLVVERLKLSGQIGKEGPKGNSPLEVHTANGVKIMAKAPIPNSFGFQAASELSNKLRQELDPRTEYPVGLTFRVQSLLTPNHSEFWRGHVFEIRFYSPDGKVEKVYDGQGHLH